MLTGDWGPLRGNGARPGVTGRAPFGARAPRKWGVIWPGLRGLARARAGRVSMGGRHLPGYVKRPGGTWEGNRPGLLARAGSGKPPPHVRSEPPLTGYEHTRAPSLP